MKFATFIRSCNLAISSVLSKKQWNDIYIYNVKLSDNTNKRITYFISNTEKITPDTTCLKISFDYSTIDNFKEELNIISNNSLCGVSPHKLAQEAINHGISLNDAGRIFYIVKVIEDKLIRMSYNVEDIELTNIYYDYDKGMIVLDLKSDNDIMSVHSDGVITLFGI